MTDNIFLNMTERHSSLWSEDQLLAARRIAPTIVNVLFPTVPHQTIDWQISQMADRIFADLHTRDSGDFWKRIKGVAVQGEHTLTAVLVRRFQEYRITCYAAAYERILERNEQGKYITTFRFFQFRPYPSLIGNRY